MFTMDQSDFAPLIFTTIAAMVLIVLYLSIHCLRKNKSKLPPVPPGGLPVVGNFLQILKTHPHLQFSKWAQKHPKLYTIQLVHRQAVVVSDAKLMKELFGKMASTGKFRTDTLLLMSQGPHGLGNTEGNVWAEQRHFCMRSMKQLGYGQSAFMEPLILNEARDACQWIRKACGESVNGGIVDLNKVMYQSPLNTLWTFVTGERFNLEESKASDMLIYLSHTLQYTMKTGLGFFPWMKYAFPKLSGYTDFDKACKDIHEYVQEKFENRKRSNQSSAASKTNLIALYIEHLDMVNKTGGYGENSFLGAKGWQNSVSTVVELFIAGANTMSATLKWVIVYLSHHVDVQDKLQQEIDDMVGRDRDPSLADMARMPYTEAVILETLRYSSIVPFGVPHELLEDVNFHDFTLPKGLILIANMYHIHHNPGVWGDPQKFRPERFLESENSQMLRNNMVPYQLGKRQCLGELLARDVIFLFVTKLFQQFNFRPDSRVRKEYYLEPDVGILLLPKCASFSITSR